MIPRYYPLILVGPIWLALLDPLDASIMTAGLDEIPTPIVSGSTSSAPITLPPIPQSDDPLFEIMGDVGSASLQGESDPAPAVCAVCMRDNSWIPHRLVLWMFNDGNLSPPLPPVWSLLRPPQRMNCSC